MLRYSFTLVVLVVFLVCSVISFAQAPDNNNIKPPQPPKNNMYNFAKIITAGTISKMGRAANNAVDKGLISTMIIFNESRNKELQDIMKMTDAQLQEIETLRKNVQMGAAMRFQEIFKGTSEIDFDADFQKFIDAANAIATPEQQAKAKELAFQATGGINSPFISKDVFEILELTKEQREKIEPIIEQAKNERNNKVEEMLKLLEERLAKKNDITPETENEFRKKREALMDDFFAIGQTTGDRLKSFLNSKQIQKAEDLIANKPSFLPRLPTKGNSPYIPNLDSWQPGQGVPDSEKDPKETKKTFPRKSSDEKN
jgi:Spy/CpxP family protein refolding chaperone